jgi:hypothetical protein
MVNPNKDISTILHHQTIEYLWFDTRDSNSLFPAAFSTCASMHQHPITDRLDHGVVVIPVIDRAATMEREARLFIAPL